MLKVLFAFFSSWVVNARVFDKFTDIDQSYSVIAAGFLAAAISVLIWIYGNWFAFLRSKRLGKKGSISWSFFDRFLIPAVPLYVFAIPLAPQVIFDPLFLLALGSCLLVLQDYGKSLTEFLWRHRFHGLERLPDSGDVSPREFTNKKNLVLALYFVLPAAVYFIKPLYASAVY